MPCQLPFFPPSLPDESLISRVSRYHLISGNRTEQSTFAELFDCLPFGLDKVVPPFIQTLASRLPGETEANLATIIQANTLFPLFRPFVGASEKKAAGQSPTRVSDSISHRPRHVVGMMGDAKLCLSCVREDEAQYGVGYWHRSHQIPGVTVCWKHKEALVSSCSECRIPFQRTKKLLTVPWLVCRCSEPLPTKGNQAVQPTELAYALYAHELLLEDIPVFPPETVMNAYREKIRQRGFIRASLPALKEFQESLIDTLGQEFISKVDPAFSANRVTAWLRFSFNESALDMPITRHLILGMHLFGTANNFSAHLHAVSREGASGNRRKNKTVEQKQNGTRDEYRRKVLSTLKKEPSISMEKLWKKHYRAVAWLFDHDKAWLNNSMDSETNKCAKSFVDKATSDEALDREYALLAEQHSRKLFEKGGKPERVTIGKILAILPKKITTARLHRDRYPVLFAMIDVCNESSWCFSARKILWALRELDRLDEGITAHNLVKKAAVSYAAVDGIMRLCDWDGEKISKSKVDPQVILAKAGITRAWRGPSEIKMGEIAGRGYSRKIASSI